MIAARVLAMGIVVVAAASLALACESPTSAGTTADGGAKGGNCASCHMPEYQHVADPVHVDLKPTQCAVCHVQDGWRPSAIHHEWWPLTGAHEKAPCSYCHKGTPAALAVLKGAPKDCVTCHRPEYDASTFPEHDTFPTKCIECHGTAAWRPAKHPPRAPDPVPTTPPLASSLPKLPPGQLPKTPRSLPTTRPTTPPTTPPRVPTSRPPPDVIARPSPLRR